MCIALEQADNSTSASGLGVARSKFMRVNNIFLVLVSFNIIDGFYKNRLFAIFLVTFNFEFVEDLIVKIPYLKYLILSIFTSNLLVDLSSYFGEINVLQSFHFLITFRKLWGPYGTCVPPHSNGYGK